MKSKIDEVIEKYKTNVITDGVHRVGINGIYIETLNSILEQLRPYVELGELFVKRQTENDLIEFQIIVNKQYELYKQIKEQENESN